MSECGHNTMSVLVYQRPPVSDYQCYSPRTGCLSVCLSVNLLAIFLTVSMFFRHNVLVVYYPLGHLGGVCGMSAHTQLQLPVCLLLIDISVR